MKLIRLKIKNKKGFRSLKKNFEIHFQEEDNFNFKFNPYVLAGRNGSGKSNVLEALAEIFYHLDGIYLDYTPNYFQEIFDPKKSRVNAYELEYFTKIDSKYFLGAEEQSLIRVSIKKKKGERPYVNVINGQEPNDSFINLSATQTKSLLPKYVVGYSSGKNETLSIPFFKSRLLEYDRYYNSLVEDEFIDITPETSLVFADEQLGQAIAVTCLLMLDNPEDEEIAPLLLPYKNYVKLQGIDSFRLIIRTDKYFEFGAPEHGKPRYSEKGEPLYDIRKAQLIQNLDLSDEGKISGGRTRSYIEKLKKCATVWNEFESEDFDSMDFFENEIASGKTYISFDFLVNDATKLAFQLHFENDPLMLFEFFQISFTLNNYVLEIKNKQRAYKSDNPFIQYDIAQIPLEEDRIIRFKDLLIDKINIPKSIYTKNLSDGEFQFIHTLGLCLLYRNSNTLFLFDEPATHFNPDWKAKYITSLRGCFENIENNNFSDMLISSHSPYLISDTDRDYVRVFNRNENDVVYNYKPEFQTLGASVNSITIDVFDKVNTVGEYANDQIAQFKKRWKNGEEVQKLIFELNKTIGDSIEKTILINQMLGNL